MPPLHVSLAWQILTYQKRRFVLSLAGIVFAVVLMYMELGFLSALYDSQVALVRQLNADLVMTSTAKYTMAINEPMPLSRVRQARAVQGVAAAYPLYVDFENPLWRNSDARNGRSIRVLGFDPVDPVFLMAEVQAGAAALKEPDTVLMDSKSQEAYGKCAPGVVTELSRRKVRVAGTFALGTDFLSGGNVIMSDKTFLKFFPSTRAPGPNLSRVELGLLKVAPGAEPSAVAQRLAETLPGDVQIQTKQAFVDQETRFWQESTPLGYLFGLGTALGFVVGVVIGYQILYTDVADHLPQFATLKAIGYRDRFVQRVVLQEALFLAVLGYVPGLALSHLLYVLVGGVTGLPMQMPPLRMALMLALTVAMCVVSALIAIRKVIAADPAEVFA